MKLRNQIPNGVKVRIFDTTLRDGQQCPGAGLSFDRNLEYARLAAATGVDVLEAGFASASLLDFEIVHTIATELAPKPDSPIIASLCQLREEQIDRTIQSLLPAVPFKKAMLHVYLPVDPELMPLSLGKEVAANLPALVKRLGDFVARAVAAGMIVEFSPEGYSRMRENFDFVTDLIRAAVGSGASVINCPDTIGGASPFQGDEFFVVKMNRHADIIKAEFPGKEVIWSTHCHNDFGLAVPNSIAAVVDGPARQIEGCFNGIGERAGNASLEQCILILKHFGERMNPEKPYYTDIETTSLHKICSFLAEHMLPQQPHWPITGKNAARHSAGGHTNAVLKNPLVYQPFDPKEVGSEISLIFGPLSGGNHARSIIQNAGYICDDKEKAEVAQYLKELYHDRRKGITDEELLKGYFKFRQPIVIDEIDYAKSAKKSFVTIAGKFFGEKGTFTGTHEGKDSALAALKQLVDQRYSDWTFSGYRSEANTSGINALSISTVMLTDSKGRLFEGTGEDSDIEISAMRAFIDAVNKAYIENQFRMDTKKPKNIVEKIWDGHVVKQLPSHPAVFAVDLMLIHEVTSAQAFQTIDDRNLPVFDTTRLIATVDHSIPTRNNRFEIFDDAAKRQVAAVRENCQRHNIPLCDMDSGHQGIVHVIGPEHGLTQPGMTIVCGDSHTSTHGAFGALAFGIGTSEVANVLATGCLLQSKPKTMRVEFRGTFQKGVYSKDAVLRLIAEIGIDGATGHVIEYAGEAIRRMTMEERMTICNMSIECGARAGLVAPDETTFAYIQGKACAPKGATWNRAVAYWKSFQSDPGANYDRQIIIDVSELKPMVTWGTNPGQATQINGHVPKLAQLPEEVRSVAKRSLEYVELREGAPMEGTPVDWAFVGSCTNGRIEDLRVAASILKGRKVHDNVTFYVVPGSERVMKEAKEEGLDEIFREAGAHFRMPGCSMCLGMNDDIVPKGKRCISSSNRNFIGRQGPGSMTHLASPATVTASAIAGKITSPETYLE